MKLAILLATALMATVLACGGDSGPPSTPTPPPTATPIPSVTEKATPAQGAKLALGDGTTLTIPPLAVAADLEVSLSRTGTPPASADWAAPLGAPLHIELQGTTLAIPATIEIPYDPALLPADMTEGEIFASYYSDELGEWVPVGGVADPVRRVLVVETTHASWWEIDSWITDALLQGLVAGFKFDLGHVLDAGGAYAGCANTEGGIIIDEAENFDYLGSCLEVDDATKPRIRIVNRRVARVRIGVESGAVTTTYQPGVLALGPLETVSFDADFANAPVSEPLVITANIDLRETVGMALVDFLLVLPGAKDAINKDVRARIVSILYENRDFADAITALSGGDVSGFSRKFSAAMGNAATRDRIAKLIIENAPKGSLLSKLGPILRSNIWVVFTGAGLATQLADAVIQMQSGQGNVKFYSNRPNTPSCPVNDAAFCEFARAIDTRIRSRDFSGLNALIQFQPYPCSQFEIDGFLDPGAVGACKGMPLGTILEVVSIGACQGDGSAITPQETAWLLRNTSRVVSIVYPGGVPAARCGTPETAMVILEDATTAAVRTWSGLKVALVGGQWRILQFVEFFSPTGDPNCPFAECQATPQLYPWSR